MDVAEEITEVITEYEGSEEPVLEDTKSELQNKEETGMNIGGEIQDLEQRYGIVKYRNATKHNQGITDLLLKMYPDRIGQFITIPFNAYLLLYETYLEALGRPEPIKYELCHSLHELMQITTDFFSQTKTADAKYLITRKRRSSMLTEEIPTVGASLDNRLNALLYGLFTDLPTDKAIEHLVNSLQEIHPVITYDIPFIYADNANQHMPEDGRIEQIIAQHNLQQGEANRFIALFTNPLPFMQITVGNKATYRDFRLLVSVPYRVYLRLMLDTARMLDLQGIPFLRGVCKHNRSAGNQFVKMNILGLGPKFSETIFEFYSKMFFLEKHHSHILSK